MLTLLLGLGSAGFWGVADYLGGVQSRRMSALTVVLWSQLLSSVVVLAVLAIVRPQWPTPELVAWGLVAGVCGGLAILFFYAGMAAGAISVVAPISACGVMVPIVGSVVVGELPGVLAWVGIGLALVGIVLVSQTTGEHGGHELRPDLYRHGRSIFLALLAAVGFGVYLLVVGQAEQIPGDNSPLWIVTASRYGSLALIVAIALRVRRGALSVPRPSLLLLALIGCLDLTANALYSYGSQHGNLAVVATLGSLYPATAVLLARAFLNERLNLLQNVGVVCALGGVVLMAAG